MNDIEKFLEERLPKTLMKSLGIEITYIGKDRCEGTMPVDERTWQPFGLLHGGASVALAESLASIASQMHIDHEKEIAVGHSISAHHLRTMKTGTVFGTAKAVHIGKRTHLWDIEMKDEEGRLISTSRCSIQVVEKR